MSTRWFVDKGGRPSGPFTLAELQQLADKGEVGRITLVYSSEHPKRILAHKVKGLFAESSTCKECGVSIEPSGARARGGLCLPCYQYSCQYRELSNSEEYRQSKVECVDCGHVVTRIYAKYSQRRCPKCNRRYENLKTKRHERYENVKAVSGCIGLAALCVFGLSMVVWAFCTMDWSDEPTDYETLHKETLRREEGERLDREQRELREAIQRAVIREELRRERGYRIP